MRARTERMRCGLAVATTVTKSATVWFAARGRGRRRRDRRARVDVEVRLAVVPPRGAAVLVAAQGRELRLAGRVDEPDDERRPRVRRGVGARAAVDRREGVQERLVVGRP